MSTWLRRLRGVVGMGATWAAVWGAAGGVTHWVFGITTDLPLPLLFGGLGFLSGVAFSVVLLIRARWRRLDTLSLPRFAAGGGIVGLVTGLLFVRGVSYSPLELLAIPATFVIASAVSAAGTLMLARRGSPLVLSAPDAAPQLGDST